MVDLLGGGKKKSTPPKKERVNNAEFEQLEQLEKEQEQEQQHAGEDVSEQQQEQQQHPLSWRSHGTEGRGGTDGGDAEADRVSYGDESPAMEGGGIQYDDIPGRFTIDEEDEVDLGGGGGGGEGESVDLKGYAEEWDADVKNDPRFAEVEDYGIDSTVRDVENQDQIDKGAPLQSTATCCCRLMPWQRGDKIVCAMFVISLLAFGISILVLQLIIPNVNSISGKIKDLFHGE